MSFVRTSRRNPLLSLAATLALAGFASAQMGVGSYSFTQYPGTYVPLTGGTVLGTATGTSGATSLDDVNYAVTLPFTFTLDGLPQTSIYVNTNGNLTFGSTAPGTTNYTPLSATTAYAGAVAAFGRDLQGGWVFAGDRLLGSNQITNVSANGPMQVGDLLTGTGIATGTTITAIAGNTITMSANATATSAATAVAAFGPWAELRYETLGSSPNQVFVVQWQNFKRYGSTLTTSQHVALNFQIRLHETTNAVEVVYGNCSPGLTTFTTTSQVGLRGPNATFPTNVNNRLNTKGVNDDWLNSLPGTSNTAGMLFNNVAPANVIQSGLTYLWAPPAGAYAGFTANVTGGASPLAVQFTDQSFTTIPGGITGWAWDFDGDNVIDSTAQNPTWVYTTCGNYTVSLTVVDGVSPANTLTRTAYIQTDRIVADFTSQLIGPGTMQFTDTSNMPATGWAWDLDGDNVVDSNAQNPVWVYPTTNPTNVTLTVTRLCAPVSTVTKSIVPLQALSHNVAANNGLSSGAMVYFDLSVTNPTGVEINSMDIVASTASTAFTVDVYMKQGSYVGFEKAPAVWTKIGTGSGTSVASTANPSPVTLAAPLYLPTGNYGIAMQYIGVGPRYQTGTVLQTVGNGDVSMTTGASLASTVGSPFVYTGTPITPRWWSGTLYYGTFNITSSAAIGTFGQGCAGTMGISHLSANQPQLGTTMALTVNNLPLSVAILMTGFSNTFSLFGPLPFDVSPYGAPGCFGRVATDATTLLIGGGNTAVWNFAIPNDPGLAGLPMFNQGLVLDPGFNGLGAVFSDATALIVGL